MEKQLKENDFIVSKTDLKGRITYVNRIFMEMSEYGEGELLGQPHNLIRHADMPKSVFKLLWDRVQNKDEVFAYVINKTKNGNDYWVFAYVTPSMDERGNTIGYYSVRRKPNQQALEVIEPLYKKMLAAEATGEMSAGMQVLEDILAKKGVSYDEFIISVQQ